MEGSLTAIENAAPPYPDDREQGTGASGSRGAVRTENAGNRKTEPTISATTASIANRAVDGAVRCDSGSAQSATAGVERDPGSVPPYLPQIRNWVKYGMTLPRWQRSIGPRSARSSASSAKPDRDGSLALLMAQRSQQCLRPADGRLILKGSASSVTEAFPDMRRARIARRVGSDSAEKVLLRRSGNISVNR